MLLYLAPFLAKSIEINQFLASSKRESFLLTNVKDQTTKMYFNVILSKHFPNGFWGNVMKHHPSLKSKS